MAVPRPRAKRFSFSIAISVSSWGQVTDVQDEPTTWRESCVSGGGVPGTPGNASAFSLTAVIALYLVIALSYIAN